jgi:hypothetical protein
MVDAFWIAIMILDLGKSNNLVLEDQQNIFLFNVKGLSLE